MPASSATKRKGAGDLTERKTKKIAPEKTKKSRKGQKDDADGTEEPEAAPEEPEPPAEEPVDPEPEAPEEEPEAPPKGKPAANVNLKKPAAKVKAKAKAKAQSAKAKAQTQSAPAGGKAKAKAKGSAKSTVEGERFEVYDQEVARSVLIIQSRHCHTVTVIHLSGDRKVSGVYFYKATNIYGVKVDGREVLQAQSVFIFFCLVPPITQDTDHLCCRLEANILTRRKLKRLLFAPECQRTAMFF